MRNKNLKKGDNMGLSMVFHILLNDLVVELSAHLSQLILLGGEESSPGCLPFGPSLVCPLSTSTTTWSPSPLPAR